jgi:uncharacterized protein YebE (UPF0316 family)
MDWNLLLWTVVIFCARLVDVGLGTVRVQMVFRRKKTFAAVIGFFEILIFIVVVSRVIQDISNWPFVLAYASGFAAGTFMGAYLSEKIAHRLVQATIICHEPWHEVAVAVRGAGFALTHFDGTGRDGHVDVIDVVCADKGLSRLMAVVKKADPNAFLYTQELSSLHGGFVYGLKGKI